MTGKILNLNKARKRRAGDAKKSLADANARRFGRSRAERDAETAERAAADKLLDGARRGPAAGQGGDGEDDAP